MPVPPTNLQPPSPEPNRPPRWDFEKLQMDLKDPLWQRVLGALQQRVQARILKLVAQSSLDPRSREVELARNSGYNELLTMFLAGTLETFAKEVLGLIEEDVAKFEPYMGLDDDETNT